MPFCETQTRALVYCLGTDKHGSNFRTRVESLSNSTSSTLVYARFITSPCEQQVISSFHNKKRG